jgi:hypothetical protein
MDKRSKVKVRAQVAPPPIAIIDKAHVVETARRLLNLLNEQDMDSGDAMLSLLLAFMQASVQVLDEGAPEAVEANRNVLLTMLEHARQVLIDPGAVLPSATVH